MSAHPQTPAGGELARSAARRAIEEARAEIEAALSLGFLAAEFVILPETWPVFLAWCDRHMPAPLEPPDRELALQLVACRAAGQLAATERQMPPGFAR